MKSKGGSKQRQSTTYKQDQQSYCNEQQSQNRNQNNFVQAELLIRCQSADKKRNGPRSKPEMKLTKHLPE